MSITSGAAATTLTGITVTDGQADAAQALIETVIGRTETTIDATTYDRRTRDLEHLARAIGWQAAFTITTGAVPTSTQGGVKSLTQPDLSITYQGTGTPAAAVAAMLSPLAAHELGFLSWLKTGSKKTNSAFDGYPATDPTTDDDALPWVLAN
jgi:hypothetical protein